MSIVSVDNIQPIGSGTTVTVNKSVTLESGNTNITGVCTATSFSGALAASNLTGALPAISGANLTSLPAQATISNNADNRIITGGSGVNLNGEANLIFNGSELYPASGIGTAVGHRLNYRRNAPQSRTNTGNAAQQYYKIGEIVLNGSESAEINIYGTQGYSNGTECAGKTTIILRATNANTLAGFWYEETLGNANLSDVRWKFSSGQTYELWIKASTYANIAPFIRCTGNGFTSFNYATGDGNAPSGSSQLSSYHRKNVGTINTIRYNSTDTTFHRNIKMDSGYGIDFSAASGSASGSASALLDDYEEGTWTATLSGNSSPTNTATNNPTTTRAVTGTYRKIGSLVHVQALWTNLQYNGSNDMHNHQLQHITGIPFTSGNASGTSVFTAPLGYSRGIYGRYNNSIIEECVLYFWMGTASTTVYLQASQIVQNSPGTLYHTVSNSSSSMYYAFNMTYHTN